MKRTAKTSETRTENLFRGFYGITTFVEKSAIPAECGFKSKSGGDHVGYPGFYREEEDVAFVAEAKPDDHVSACNEVRFYLSNNDLKCDLIGLAVSGQDAGHVKLTAFVRIDGAPPERLLSAGNFVSLKDLVKEYRNRKYGDSITDDGLMAVLRDLNREFHNEMHIKDTERSLFFAGIMIALKDRNFYGTYQHVNKANEPQKRGVPKLIEAHNLNKAMLDAIESQIAQGVNNRSKEYNWRDRFSFIKNIDYPLAAYKALIKKIQERVFNPFKLEEKQDILARAYRIFLSRAGNVENRNIILTPDHIKRLMIALARLHVDDVVLDTCTGSGGFLMEAMDELVGQANHDAKKIAKIKSRQLIGIELDPTLFALACSNMFLHGDGRTNLIFRSSLLSAFDRDDKEFLKYIKSFKPNKVIINPPYEKNGAILFTRQALEYMEPGGRLIIIMPTPTLNKNVNTGLTEEVLNMARLDFVIKMPNNLFAEQKRSVNTSIFGFTKGKHLPQDEVVFYNMDDDGFVSVQHKGRVDKYGKWNAIFQNVIDRLVYNKMVSAEYENRVLFNGGAIYPYGVRKDSKGKSNLMKVSDLFAFEKGALASEDAIDGEYAFVTASKDYKTHVTYDHDCEAIVYAVAAGGSLGRAHYINGKFIASNLCLILTPKDPEKFPVNLQFYAYYLNAIRRRLVNDLADGTSKPTIRKEDLADYKIEYVAKGKQDAYVEKFCPVVADLAAKLRAAEQACSDGMLDLIR